jgi:hypothetical protein
MTIHERVSCSSFLMGQTINLFYRIVAILIIITLHSQICKAFQLFQCNYNLNYTKGSKFESNLNTVMNRLVQNTSQTGFNTSEYGQSPDKIYGLLQCMGDTTGDQCHNCSQQANTNLLKNCGNARGGLIWPDNGCFLRYENYSFFGHLDQSNERTFLSNPQNVSSPDGPDYKPILQNCSYLDHHYSSFTDLQGTAIASSVPLQSQLYKRQ